MSGGGNSTTTQVQSVPDWIKPYYESTLQNASTLANGQGPAYYPGNQVAPLNSMQEQGYSSIANAANGPQATPGAVASNQFATSGALMDPSSNPYLQDTFHQAANGVQNQLSSEFAGSGRNIIGSLPIQSDMMNNLATQLYGGQYQAGVNSTLQAQALAPTLDAGSYIPGQAQLSAGAGLQDQTQNNINQNINAWNYQQQLPYNQDSWFSGLLSNNAQPFKSGSTTLPTNRNQGASALGGAASGAATGASLSGGNPYGVAAGAVVGGLLGAFG